MLMLYYEVWNLQFSEDYKDEEMLDIFIVESLNISGGQTTTILIYVLTVIWLLTGCLLALSLNDVGLGFIFLISLISFGLSTGYVKNLFLCRVLLMVSFVGVLNNIFFWYGLIRISIVFN
jgi:hypothetical protein